jgi:hypothetical protein
VHGKAGSRACVWLLLPVQRNRDAFIPQFRVVAITSAARIAAQAVVEEKSASCGNSS